MTVRDSATTLHGIDWGGRGSLRAAGHLKPPAQQELRPPIPSPSGLMLYRPEILSHNRARLFRRLERFLSFEPPSQPPPWGEGFC